jgi:hypothetical protein
MLFVSRSRSSLRSKPTPIPFSCPALLPLPAHRSLLACPLLPTGSIRPPLKSMGRTAPLIPLSQSPRSEPTPTSPFNPARSPRATLAIPPEGATHATTRTTRLGVQSLRTCSCRMSRPMRWVKLLRSAQFVDMITNNVGRGLTGLVRRSARLWRVSQRPQW